VLIAAVLILLYTAADAVGLAFTPRARARLGRVRR
jgi:hypothetical protein